MASVLREESKIQISEWKRGASASSNKKVEESNSVSAVDWFCPETRIYTSTYKSIPLPKHPYLDVVSFIFSHSHNGVSALVDSTSGFSLSYLKLEEMVNSLACGLHDLGVRQKDVVLILLPNTVFYPVIFLGILSTGGIATPMNPLSSLKELKKQILECKVSVVFAESENAKTIEKLNMGLRVIKVPPVETFVQGGTLEYECFRKLVAPQRRRRRRSSAVVISQDDTAAILYSSGTSGVSKGVVLSHRNLISTVELFVKFEASMYVKSEPNLEDVYLATVPMFHVYGMSLFSTGLLALGSTIVVIRKFSADEMVKAIDKYKVTHFPAVPPLLMALIREKALTGCNLGSMKQVSCGAAPTSEKLILEFLEKFPHVNFIQGYGMTETSALGARGFNTAKCRKYNSAGLLEPNMEAKVVDRDTGCCLPPGKTGELWLRAPGIMKGYLNNTDATTSAVDKDGWLQTGDIVYFDQDGHLYVVDRLKDMIKYKGFQIAPADLEDILLGHPEILDAAVAGCADDDAGEIPVAFVVKKPGSTLTRANVIDFVASQVAPHKKVRKVVFTHSIPKSPAGKILRRKLKDTLVSRL